MLSQKLKPKPSRSSPDSTHSGIRTTCLSLSTLSSLLMESSFTCPTNGTRKRWLFILEMCWLFTCQSLKASNIRVGNTCLSTVLLVPHLNAPRDEYLSVHIRTLGDWTRQLKTVFSENISMFHYFPY